MSRGIYVHIPFCLVRCSYCDFNAYAGLDHLAGDYVKALRREITSLADRERVDTIFFGGGTPTQLDPKTLGSILGGIKESFEVSPDSEVTVEANPETIDSRMLDGLLSQGFNRLSVGVQSTSSAVLEKLDRVHSAERALQALSLASAAGFRHLNADLIYGTQGETAREWSDSLEAVLQTGPNHVSCYALTVEEGTPLAARIERGFPQPDEDDQAEKYERAHRLLVGAGFGRYEISNWALPGGECRHNLRYWHGGEYLGLGAGAHSHVSGVRRWNLKNPRTYIAKSPDVIEGAEQLDPEERMEEEAILALRTARGLSRAEFLLRWGEDPVELWSDVFRDLGAQGLVSVTSESVAPTDRGFLLNGYVSRAILSTLPRRVLA